MQISPSRQPNTNRPIALSGSVLAALLSALLLLSPGAARALAHVLAENGVAIPPHFVRVLDTLATDPAPETPRRRIEHEDDEEAIASAPAPIEQDAPAVTDTAMAIATEAVSLPNWIVVTTTPTRLPEVPPLRRLISGPRSSRAPPVPVAA